ncbi:uncharacterized protein PHACADRAFT_266463 [Phanerochaete carnosa HHB-10118-sp]|uniref:Uncharacterized protein n=1 Tax=Phanerochaete carnosa (strain HHB-10118-sp) TaxID=650164 RepID=K5VNU7_PHACS|nr:uncharacterized protein PHACADRAFT_266463 [Phanerochaete carnosa HHB-10118-sp]EKM48264.1 hypothetical protein PHACADRAFT_266463 [Phanerochaete carnosa HHB-10118-sp]
MDACQKAYPRITDSWYGLSAASAPFMHAEAKLSTYSSATSLCMRYVQAESTLLSRLRDRQFVTNENTML